MAKCEVCGVDTALVAVDVHSGMLLMCFDCETKYQTGRDMDTIAAVINAQMAKRERVSTPVSSPIISIDCHGISISVHPGIVIHIERGTLTCGT